MWRWWNASETDVRECGGYGGENYVNWCIRELSVVKWERWWKENFRQSGILQRSEKKMKVWPMLAKEVATLESHQLRLHVGSLVSSQKRIDCTGKSHWKDELQQNGKKARKGWSPGAQEEGSTQGESFVKTERQNVRGHNPNRRDQHFQPEVPTPGKHILIFLKDQVITIVNWQVRVGIISIFSANILFHSKTMPKSEHSYQSAYKLWWYKYRYHWFEISSYKTSSWK